MDFNIGQSDCMAMIAANYEDAPNVLFSLVYRENGETESVGGSGLASMSLSQSTEAFIMQKAFETSIIEEYSGNARTRNYFLWAYLPLVGGGATPATRGELWVSGEELRYGDGNGWERFFFGFDTGVTGTAGEIICVDEDSVLTYTSATGKVREISLWDIGTDGTAGEIYCEASGNRLRFTDDGAKNRERQGNLV